ncbi:hypothetical protein ELI00_31260 (plasmid) [Rhizobium ruizarguesonis]|uniref:Uncharacterized protein n=1 Tax=Rhizobium ruizarguesonis TaxID=2081791 RepID=A0AAE4YUN2_9HYPH|nr:hypothetical protein [Rhizobium ruizarguesonis]NKL13229.1 hypothetical protein [Rhizobium leguminosarum bv. viciae]NEI51460.1 hypothetical protein [Rhizobium ruizarguesonis]TAT71450.1 hypothetical protein ELI52_35690 [Rhizobium ruizarguesonis]TAW62697.1 hypothetical protein ELI16_30870 [Rhizobium ruizarguesonis]TAW81847.1 hypothetical protein ELI11_29605 [Rhizobium ruizarguesonis]
MEKHIVKADGNGAIDVNGQVWLPIPSASSKGRGRSYEVDIRLMAPRDWLLQRGFERDAVLVSQSGARIPIYHHDGRRHDDGNHYDGRLDAADTISIELTARDDSCTSEVDLMRKYPEFDGADSRRTERL